MKNGPILVISNDEKTGKLILDKVKLLRDYDDVQLVNYIESISVLNTTLPSLIMVYSSNTESISIIKEIRALKYLDKVPIILILDYFIEDVLLYAFDNGIDDFFFLNDSDAIILMRILLTLQKSIMYKQIETANEVLMMSGYMEKKSGIYTKEQAGAILKLFFNKSLEENLEKSVFMCVKPVAEKNQKMNIQNIAEIIRKIPRGDDIVTYGKNSAFYFLLYNSGIEGAKSIVERIKQALYNKCTVYASATEITASFEEVEPIILRRLKEQISAGAEFSYSNDITLSETAQTQEGDIKRFKDFRKEFYNGFEKIVAPVFYQVQAKALEVFPQSKANFDITELESKFVISQDKVKSELIITYPSYMKLLIDIKHTSENKRPLVKRLTYDFEDFSSEKLLSLLQDLMNRFELKLKAENKENKSSAKSK